MKKCAYETTLNAGIETSKAITAINLSRDWDLADRLNMQIDLWGPESARLDAERYKSDYNDALYLNALINLWEPISNKLDAESLAADKEKAYLINKLIDDIAKIEGKDHALKVGLAILER